jgi:hypothetical protein
MNYFDWNYYIENNVDLKKNGITTKEDAILHWKEYGLNEGRIHKFVSNITEYYIMNVQNLLLKNVITKEGAWNILISMINEKENTIYGDFDWEYYITENKDLFIKSIHNKKDAIEHFNTIGKFNNNFKYSKDYFILETITKDNFDWGYYLEHNLDLIKNDILNLDKAWDHWCNYGKYENRKYKCKYDRNITYETFDWEYYLENNIDLINLTQEGAWQHWIYYGRNEERKIRLYEKNKNIINFEINEYKDINFEENINTISNIDDNQIYNIDESNKKNIEDFLVDNIENNNLNNTQNDNKNDNKNDTQNDNKNDTQNDNKNDTQNDDLNDDYLNDDDLNDDDLNDDDLNDDYLNDDYLNDDDLNDDNNSIYSYNECSDINNYIDNINIDSDYDISND